MLLSVENLEICLTRDGVSTSLCRNINFSLNRGESLGILGESGSGKSLSALSIPKLLPPGIICSSGEIFFTKKNNEIVKINSLSTSELQSIRGSEIGMVFQEPMSSLNPVFTCGDQVAEAIIKHQKISSKEARELSLNLFEKVKLPDPKRVFDSHPHQLSGGQKQRVMISMAISCKPQLLIADEPTTALDVTVQRSIIELLKELQAEMNMGIIFITHDIGVLSNIANRTLVFQKGEIVEQGEVSQILNAPQHPYTKHLIECRSRRLAQNQMLEKDSQTLFSVSNLNVSYKKKGGLFKKATAKQILKNVSFEIERGETIGLVGESGSGKTTIGRSIMHLVQSTCDNMLFEGLSVSKMTETELKRFRKKVQIIFQDPYSSLNPKLSIGKSIEEPLIVHYPEMSNEERRMRVLNLLAMVNLDEEHYNRYPHQFSGGQRQRIGIARALAVEPQLLILDESVAALDVSIQSQILSLLNDLKQKLKLTYIFISHDLDVVRSMSNRIIVLKNGEIVEEGSANQIFTAPQHIYTKQLIAAIP